MIKRIRLVICQPRTGNFSEWTITVDELLAFAKEVGLAVQAARKPSAPLVATEKGCKFCRASANCPALREAVALTVSGAISAPMTADDFDDLTVIKPNAGTTPDYLASAMSKVGMVEIWCKAVRAETETRLLRGESVEGYKLVEGKQGNRRWSDPETAEALLKSLRLKVEDMFDLSLISPTKAEKLANAKTIGPRQWVKVLPLIVRSPGTPSVAPVTDKRPALNVSAVADDFDVVQTPVSEFV